MANGEDRHAQKAHADMWFRVKYVLFMEARLLPAATTQASASLSCPRSLSKPNDSVITVLRSQAFPVGSLLDGRRDHHFVCS